MKAFLSAIGGWQTRSGRETGSRNSAGTKSKRASMARTIDSPFFDVRAGRGTGCLVLVSHRHVEGTGTD